jgi:hypothetical protein
MPQRSPTLRTTVLLLALAASTWLLPLSAAPVPLAGALLAGTSSQPGDLDAG